MKIVQAEGQMCNQFWIYTNYITDAIEENTKITILAPDISIKDFPNLIESKNIVFPFYRQILIQIFGYETYINILNRLFANRYTKSFLSNLFKYIPKISYTDAKVTCPKSKFRLKYRYEIEVLFSPNDTVKNTVNEIFSKKLGENSIIVGVHIRRGDYKTYENGKYFFTDAQYHCILLKIKELFKDKNVLFFISSNEKVDLNDFQGCDCFSVEHSTAAIDLYGLSMADYIVGPPSTFSGWASFYGDKPLYFIESLSKSFDKDDFKNILEVWS